MKKTHILAYALLATALTSQAAFANDKAEVQAQEITKEEVAAAAEDYQVEQIERIQPRRSALFLHILDNVVKGSTLAKSEPLPDYTTQLSELFGTDGTLL